MCDRVTRWLSPFRLSIRYYLIVTGFSGLAELPSSAPILVGWAGYGCFWLKWLLGYLVLINARWYFRRCSFTYRWPYDRFWISHIVSFCFSCIVLFWAAKCTVRVLSFLSEGVACTVKVLPILYEDAACTVKVLPWCTWKVTSTVVARCLQICCQSTINPEGVTLVRCLLMYCQSTNILGESR